MKTCISESIKKFHRFIKSDKSTLHKLNYITLRIDSEEITRDLFQHSIDQKISLFWIMNILAIANFLLSLSGFIRSGSKSMGRVLLPLIYITVLGPIFALFRWRFKRAIRFIPVLIFMPFAILLCVGVLSDRGKIII